MSDKNGHNPFKIAWYILTSLASVASLSNMVGDLVQWAGLLGRMLETYRSVVYPPFEWAFSFLPFAVPTLVFDYLVVGLLFGGLFTRAVVAKIALKEVDGPFEHSFAALFAYAATLPVFALGWPVLFLGSVLVVLDGRRPSAFTEEGGGHDTDNYEYALSALSWFAATLVLTILLLIGNEVYLAL